MIYAQYDVGGACGENARRPPNESGICAPVEGEEGRA